MTPSSPIEVRADSRRGTLTETEVADSQPCINGVVDHAIYQALRSLSIRSNLRMRVDAVGSLLG